MKTIRPLIKLVHNTDKFDIAGAVMEQRGGFLMRRFYEGVANDIYTTDSDAKDDLYRGERNRTGYAHLKQRTLRTLSGVFLFLLDKDESPESSYLAAHSFCKKQITAVEFMITKGQSKVSENLLQKVYEVSKKFQITDVHSKACYLLHSVATLKGESTKLQRYREEMLYADKLHVAEKHLRMQVRELFATSAIKLGSKLGEDALDSHLVAADASVEGLQSMELSADLFRIKNYVHQSLGQYENALEACERYESELFAAPHLSTTGKEADVCIHKAHNLFHLRRYELGADTAQRAVHLLTEGSDNWFAAMESLLLNLSSAGEISEAREVVDHALQTHKEVGGKPSLVERWFLFDALFEVYECLKEGTVAKVDLPKLKLVSKDHNGLKVIALVVELLGGLSSDSLDGILDKANSIKIFVRRYLDKRDPRGTAFLKCLGIMINQNFDYTRTSILAEKHVKRMESPKSFEIEQIEVVPYLALWDAVLHRLKQIEDRGEIVVPRRHNA